MPLPNICDEGIPTRAARLDLFAYSHGTTKAERIQSSRWAFPVTVQSMSLCRKARRIHIHCPILADGV